MKGRHLKYIFKTEIKSCHTSFTSSFSIPQNEPQTISVSEIFHFRKKRQVTGRKTVFTIKKKTIVHVVCIINISPSISKRFKRGGLEFTQRQHLFELKIK